MQEDEKVLTEYFFFHRSQHLTLYNWEMNFVWSFYCRQVNWTSICSLKNIRKLQLIHGVGVQLLNNLEPFWSYYLSHNELNFLIAERSVLQIDLFTPWIALQSIHAAACRIRLGIVHSNKHRFPSENCHLRKILPCGRIISPSRFQRFQMISTKTFASVIEQIKETF